AHSNFSTPHERSSVIAGNEVITVKTPAFAESVTEGDVRWEKAVGDTVSEDEVVCEIETDKVSTKYTITRFLYDYHFADSESPFVVLLQVKMNRMRLRIAQRLKEAQNTCAMLTTFNEVDMRFVPVKANQPTPVIDDSTKEIVYRDYVDISARKNELAVEDMDGGTFTISNGGVFGSMFGTPIINPPQSAILGMHGIFDRPVAIAGKVRWERFCVFCALCSRVNSKNSIQFLHRDIFVNQCLP
ncbi:hypothetical protein cypCar_00035953, partial [Cyprinus carpio]